jgi:hypothetical protein
VGEGVASALEEESGEALCAHSAQAHSAKYKTVAGMVCDIPRKNEPLQISLRVLSKF